MKRVESIVDGVRYVERVVDVRLDEWEGDEGFQAN